MKAETHAKKFIKANTAHPFIRGAWLDKDKRRDPHPDEATYLRVTLENGQTFTLHKNTVDAMLSMGHQLQ